MGKIKSNKLMPLQLFTVMHIQSRGGCHLSFPTAFERFTVTLTRSSGGPSSASSADCSSPILLRNEPLYSVKNTATRAMVLTTMVHGGVRRQSPQVPDIEPAVGATGGQDGLVVGGPLDL